MAICVKKRYDARQYVAGAWGLGLGAWGFFSLLLIPDPLARVTSIPSFATVDQGSVPKSKLTLF